MNLVDELLILTSRGYEIKFRNGLLGDEDLEIIVHYADEEKGIAHRIVHTINREILNDSADENERYVNETLDIMVMDMERRKAYYP